MRTTAECPSRTFTSISARLYSGAALRATVCVKLESAERNMSLTEVLGQATRPEDARATMEFEKMRFELSWRYFDFHARQRTQLFHFFIILAPFLFGGCFYLFREREMVGSWPGLIASSAGALLAICFFGLDRRNRQIIHLSE